MCVQRERGRIILAALMFLPWPRPMESGLAFVRLYVCPVFLLFFISGR